MKLEKNKAFHIIEAAKQIDEQGSAKNYVSSRYYVIVDDKEIITTI